MADIEGNLGGDIPIPDTAYGVPVTSAGIKIGTAVVQKDGHISITLDGYVGQALYDTILTNQADGLSVHPNIIPSKPRTPQEIAKDTLRAIGRENG